MESLDLPDLVSNPFFVGAVAAFLVVVWLLQSPWLKGLTGEIHVNRQLRARLDQDTYHVFRDLLVSAPEGSTQIDHVVVSRYGVFVIETKNMSGWIFGTADQPQWTQVIYRFKSRFQNPIRQNYGHLRTLQGLLGLETRQLHNFVAFVGSATPKTAMPAHVTFSARELTHQIGMRQTPLLSDVQVCAIIERLSDKSLRPTSRSRREHVRRLKANALAPRPLSATCPRCGAKMIARTNRKSGVRFMACTR